MDIKLNKKLNTPLYSQIALQIRTKILLSEITDGCVLPSERSMAEHLGVHRNTIIRAYSELKAQGYIEARHGVGYMVSYKEAGTEDREADKREPEKKERPKDVNWQSIIKDEYQDMEMTFDDLFSRSYGSDTISFAGGMAAGDIYRREDIMAGLEAALESKTKDAYFYTPYQGDYALRHQLALFLRERGILTNASEIQIFSETNQAFDFLVSLMLNPGDTVLTEEPLSPDVYRAIELAGLKQVTVPMDEDGMICDNLGALIEKHRPKMIYINSSYHDPTGVILSLERRKKLLELSYKYRIPIIEEDAASLISFEGAAVPSVRSLDKGENVIYMYTFALTLIPGINIAFVVAPKEVVRSLSYLVSIRLISLDWIPQKILEYYLKKKIYRQGIAKIRTAYREKMELMHRLICEAEIDGFYAKKPKGGVYIWCHIPDHINVTHLVEEALRKGVGFIPGNIFYPNKTQLGNYIRLNYSAASLEEIEAGMGILVGLLRSY